MQNSAMFAFLTAFNGKQPNIFGLASMVSEEEIAEFNSRLFALYKEYAKSCPDMSEVQSILDQLPRSCRQRFMGMAIILSTKKLKESGVRKRDSRYYCFDGKHHIFYFEGGKKSWCYKCKKRTRLVEISMELGLRVCDNMVGMALYEKVSIESSLDGHVIGYCGCQWELLEGVETGIFMRTYCRQHPSDDNKLTQTFQFQGRDKNYLRIG